MPRTLGPCLRLGGTNAAELALAGCRYARVLPALAMSADPAVVGVMAFTMLAPCGPRLSAGDGSCDPRVHSGWIIEVCAKGCAIADAFAELAGTT